MIRIMLFKIWLIFVRPRNFEIFLENIWMTTLQLFKNFRYWPEILWADAQYHGDS